MAVSRDSKAIKEEGERFNSRLIFGSPATSYSREEMDAWPPSTMGGSDDLKKWNIGMGKKLSDMSDEEFFEVATSSVCKVAGHYEGPKGRKPAEEHIKQMEKVEGGWNKIEEFLKRLNSTGF